MKPLFLGCTKEVGYEGCISTREKSAARVGEVAEISASLFSFPGGFGFLLFAAWGQCPM